ncbi:MAG: hypothetical protein OXI48_06310, partial [bacterium]|nr:hypothetical protein [bacterium]
MRGRSLRGRLCRAVLVGLLVSLVVAGLPSAAGAQQATGQPAGQVLEARVLARAPRRTHPRGP